MGGVGTPAPLKGLDWRVVAAVIVGALFVGALVARAGTPPDRTTDAYVACRQFVRDRVATPATAEFPPTSGARITGDGDGPYVVAATVDAENSFGALVRSEFTCTVSRVEGGWRLDDLTLR